MDRRLAPYGLRWLEEPVWPPENYAGLARVRAAGRHRIAAGENTGRLLDRSGAPRPPRRQHHDDLHPCPQPRPRRRPQSRRPDVQAMRILSTPPLTDPGRDMLQVSR